MARTKTPRRQPTHRPKTQPGRGSPPRVGPMTGRLAAVPALDVDALIADESVRIIVCCGSGGVGKTTTAASLALRAAEQGRKAVVLTIDPARRLAQSMGGCPSSTTCPAPCRVSTPAPAAASTR
jgi:Mrp family chromosome partitioning ATPase